MINIDTSNWKTYKLDELFEKIEVNTLPYKANDLPTNPDDIYNLPALTAGVDNQGLSRFVPREGATILKNCISVSANGANTGVMFYQPNEFTVLQDSYALKWKRKEQIGEKEYLFLISVMQRVIKGNYNWSNKAGWNKIRNIEIKLPVIEIDEIDFDFMDSLISELEEERISELEEERISELDAYLKVSDLDNYKLSKDEELILQNFSSKTFKQFSIVKDVFYVNNTHNILSSDIKPNSGTTPYVTAGEKNNSVSTYIKYDENQIEKGNGIMIGGKTLVVTYQKDPYFSNDSHNLALYLKNIALPTEDEMLFLVSSLYKSLKHKYSWGDSISRKKIQTDTLSLPVDENGEIDYEYMKKIIHIIKKLVVKDVVDWKDKIINKTKEIVYRD